MTNPVNAGADIEKELAEKWGYRTGSCGPDKWLERRDEGGQWLEHTTSDIALAVFASLLAEAGERKRVEADLEHERSSTNCDN